MTESLPPLVITDIGGTHLRLARVRDAILQNVEKHRCDEGGPVSVLADYLERHQLDNAMLCMAIASPLTGADTVTMTNFNWSFSRRELKSTLALQELFVINDFHAMSLCVPNLEADDVFQTGGDKPDPSRTRVICGPGTGMGLGHLLPSGKGWQVMSGEGGHGDFAPNSIAEARIWECLFSRQGHVCIEDLLSGPGLEALYRTLCEIESRQAEALSAADISSRAVTSDDRLCVLALNTFCEMLGSWCGSIAINAGALGGVYIAGGMVTKFQDFFINSNFRQRFDTKGDYSFYTRQIPVYVVTHPQPGLLGTAEYLRGRLAELGYSPTLQPFRVQL